MARTAQLERRAVAVDRVHVHDAVAVPDRHALPVRAQREPADHLARERPERHRRAVAVGSRHADRLVAVLGDHARAVGGERDVLPAREDDRCDRLLERLDGREPPAAQLLRGLHLAQEGGHGRRVIDVLDGTEAVEATQRREPQRVAGARGLGLAALRLDPEIVERVVTRRLGRVLGRLLLFSPLAGVGGEPAEAEHRRGRYGDQSDRATNAACARHRVEGQRGEQRVHRRPALAGPLLEPAQDDPLQPARDVRARGDRRLGVEDRLQQRRDVAGGERARAVQRLEQGDGERELIRPRVADVALERLGRHVRGGPEQRAGRGQRRPQIDARGALEGGCDLGLSIGRPREAEVADKHPPVRADEHVRRFEVAVDQPGRVGRREPATGGEEDALDVAPAPRRLGEPLAEVDAVDELHGDEQLVAQLTDLIDLDDVGVGQAGHRLGLAEDPPAPLGARAGQRASQLDRHLAVELRVVRGAHDTHAALAELLQKCVAADRRRLGVAEQGAMDAVAGQPLGQRALGGGRRLELRLIRGEVAAAVGRRLHHCRMVSAPLLPRKLIRVGGETFSARQRPRRFGKSSGSHGRQPPWARCPHGSRGIKGQARKIESSAHVPSWCGSW